MTRDEVRKEARMSFHIENKRLEGDTDKNIYVNGYMKGYHKAVVEVKDILLNAPNNKEIVEQVKELIMRSDYGG